MRYIAFLRGIMPTNPNMKSDKLRYVFEKLGFTNVHTIIASGNVIFDTPERKISIIEERIEKAFPEELGFESMTIVRTRSEIEELVKKNPFKNVKDERPNYLVVTFFKDGRPEMATVLHLDEEKATGFMSDLDKKYAKKVTTRTWKTIYRVIRKFEDTDSNR